MTDALLTAAAGSFPVLSEAEQELLLAAAAGTVADCSFDNNINPTQSAKWGKRRMVRAELLRWLLTDGNAAKLINPYGLRIRAARVVGTVDLDSIKVAFPLTLRFCAITGGINLRDAETRRLDFGGSRVAWIEGSGLEVRGDLILGQSFRASLGVNLLTAKIHGSFDCTDGAFRSQRGDALNADGATVGGDVFLRNRFEAVGGVSLFGADIKLSCDCSYGRFSNELGKAVYFSKATIGANLFMRDVRATGEVRLHGAQITGNLECQGSSFRNHNGDAIALLADGMKVGGRAFLSERFVADGEVSLIGSAINGDLNCAGGQFDGGKSRRALSLDRASISGSAHLSGGFTAAGEVSLYGASITGDLDCRGGSFSNERGTALSATEVHVGTNVVLDDGFRALGEVSLRRATVNGNLRCQAGRFVSPARRALIVDGATVKGDVMAKGLVALGEVGLYGTMIGGNFDCGGGTFVNCGRRALYAATARIGLDLCLEKSRVLGEANLSRTTIDGEVNCRGSRFLNRGGVALDIEDATVRGKALLSSGFRAYGTVRLTGAAVSGDLDCSGGQFLNYRYAAIHANRLKVSHDARFSRMRTNGLIHLCNASLETLDFCNAEFYGAAENGVVAANARIAGDFVWSELKRTAGTRLDLGYAQINQLRDDEESWPEQDKLHLDGLAYNAIAAGPMNAAKRLTWLRRQSRQYFSPQPYEQLTQVLRRSGHEKDAKLVAMGKQDDRRRRGGMGSFARFGNLLLKVTIGHGYRPQWALYWGLAIVFVLAAPIFDWAYDQGLMVPTNEKVLTSETYKTKRVAPEYYPSFNPYAYSLETFLPAVNLRQKEAWQPNDEARCTLFGRLRPCGRMLRRLTWVEIVAGWILTPLCLMAVSGLVRKD